MNKDLTVKDDRIFRRAYSKGKTFAASSVVVYAKKNGLSYNRTGLTSSKKIGCAVKRNRARRVMREAYRLQKESLVSGYDLIFVARTKTCFCKTEEVFNDMKTCFEKLGLAGGKIQP